MEKEKYTRTEVQITEFQTEDVITSSSIVQDHNDLPILSINIDNL